jgi:hypothetical protein
MRETSQSKDRFGLRVLRGERPDALFLLPAEGDVAVGRAQFPTDEAIDAPHAIFSIFQGRLVLRVLPTIGGVYRRLRDEARIEPGALFSVGGHHLRFLGKLPMPQEKIFGAPRPKALYGVEELLSGGIAGRRIVRPTPRLTIGTSGCDFNLPRSPDAAIQERHCELAIEKEACLLRDLDSASGTFLRLAEGESFSIEAGEELRIGAQFLRVEML